MQKLTVKGTQRVILSDSPCEAINVRFTTAPLKPSFDKNVEDNVVYLNQKVFISANSPFFL